MLARLQADALRVPADPGVWGALERGLRAAELAEAQGFTVVGRGTSRVAVEQSPTAVAKVAYDLLGLALNLHEMGVWSTFPEPFRQYLAPCLELTPALVLIQRRVEVIGTPLTGGIVPDDVDAWLEQRNADQRQFAERIYECRAELGLDSDRDPDALRLDNFGLHEGRVVMVDYGDQFPPLPAVWARLLGRDTHLTWRDLAERASSDPTCLCGIPLGDSDSEADVAEFMAEGLGFTEMLPSEPSGAPDDLNPRSGLSRPPERRTRALSTN